MHNSQDNPQKSVDDFSLAIGGPLYQLYLRTRLAKPPLKLTQRRIGFFLALTWLPLFVLTMISGTAFHGVSMPFIVDYAAHARLIIALVLLILMEVIVHQRIHRIVSQFIKRNLIPKTHMETFHQIVISSLRLRNSMTAEILLLITAVCIGHWFWKEFSTLDMATWYAKIENNKILLTPAGYWFVFISLPVFQFILLRWYYRIFIWYRFLWKVSRIPLQLNSLHPDKAGGIAFLADTIFIFSPFILAHTVLLAGIIANLIWHTGALITDFKLEIIGYILYLIIIMLLPLFFFTLQLLRTKAFGTLDYGTTASHYVDLFREKWIQTKNDEKIIGSQDIQSLADLSNSFQVTSEMRLTPFSRATFLKLIVIIALPLVPLLIALMPIETMMMNVIKVIF